MKHHVTPTQIVKMFLELLIAFVVLVLLEMEQFVLVSLKPKQTSLISLLTKYGRHYSIFLKNILQNCLVLKSILDINECNGTPCHFNANCQNVPGTFNCICRSGFTENGTNCVGKFATKRKQVLFHC